MYTRKGIIEEIKKLYGEISKVQDKIISSRLNKDSAKELKALRQMESLAIGVQQDLMVIRGYLETHPTAADIKRIVNIADKLCEFAGELGWSEEEYYTKVLEEYENQNQKTH